MTALTAQVNAAS